MDEIIKIRRQIHQNPELSFCEYKTAETVAKYLEKLWSFTALRHCKNRCHRGYKRAAMEKQYCSARTWTHCR